MFCIFIANPVWARNQHFESMLRCESRPWTLLNILAAGNWKVRALFSAKKNPPVPKELLQSSWIVLNRNVKTLFIYIFSWSKQPCARGGVFLLISEYGLRMIRVFQVSAPFFNHCPRLLFLNIYIYIYLVISLIQNQFQKVRKEVTRFLKKYLLL